MSFVIQHTVQSFRTPLNKFFTGNDCYRAGRPDIFLYPGINQRKLLRRDRFTQNIRRHIRDQRYSTGFRINAVLCAFDRIISRDMQISAVFRQPDLARLRHPVILFSLTAERDNDLAYLFRLFYSFIRKITGHGISRRLSSPQKIHRHHRKLQAGAASHKEHAIIVAQTQKLLDVGFRLSIDFFINRRAVTHFQNRHTAALQIQQLGLYLLQHFQRQHGRTGIKIIDTFHYSSSPIKCTTIASRSLGSNQVDFGGMILPASATLISSSIDVGYMAKATL